MSPKQGRFRADAEHASPLSLDNVRGSDNRCDATLSDSDSESVSDSPSRAPKVGLRGGRYLHHTLAEKLAARTIKQPNGCWEVQGCKCNHAGHVHLSLGSSWRPPYVRVLAHRFAWEQANGRTIPPGMVIMHACDNGRCVNPDHLSVGTQCENVRDSIRKGRYNTFGIQKLNAEQVREIRARAKTGETQRSIAKAFGIARNTVSGIVHHKSWAHLTDHPALDAVFERVPSVQVQVVGELHIGHSTETRAEKNCHSLTVAR